MVTLGILGFLGLLVCLVMVIISAIRKNGKAKKWGIGILICSVVFIVGAVNAPPSTGDSAPDTTAANNSQPKSATTSNIEASNTSTKEPASNTLVKYITREQYNNIAENMTYKDFVTMIGGEGELTYNRDGFKTYSFYLKDTDIDIYVLFENGVLFDKVNSEEQEDSDSDDESELMNPDELISKAQVSDNVTITSSKVGEKRVVAYAANGLQFTMISIKKYSSIGDESAGNGVFWVAQLGIANHRKESVSIASTYFVLVDPNGNEYDASEEAEYELLLNDKKVYSYQTINPNMNYSGMIPFLVPKGIEQFSLKYKGELFEEDVVIPFEVQEVN